MLFFFLILEIAHIPVTLPVNSIAQNSVKKIGISTLNIRGCDLHLQERFFHRKNLIKSNFLKK